MEISKNIRYIGVNDHQIDLFEGQYTVPNGMAYNSYVILDKKIAVMDTVDTHFSLEWLKNLKDVLNGKTPDYLIIQHMEPDHSGSITEFVKTFPETKIVASQKAFTMMNQFFGTDYPEKQVVVGLGDTLKLGDRTLSFVTAPMVHWPEVIVTYDDVEKILFSADGFGKFGALDVEEEWDSEAGRYYFGIVGKYGAQVQLLLKKASALDIEMVCPLHGPVLAGDDLANALSLYDTWSSYAPEKNNILIAYTSIYGHTKVAAEKLYETIKSLGYSNVDICDLAREDMAECVNKAFRSSKTVFASPTYNADVFPYMRNFIEHLTERNYQNRTVGFIENGSWAPMSAKVMQKMLENCKNLIVVEPTVTIKGSLNKTGEEEIKALATEIIK